MVKLTLCYVSTIILTLSQYSSSWTTVSYRTASPALPAATTAAAATTSQLSNLQSTRFTTTILKERSSDDIDNENVIFDHSLPKDENVWKTEGERIIKEAALDVGGKLIAEDDIDIQWKSGKIVVTISNAILSGGKGNNDDDDDVEIEYDDDGYDYLEEEEDSSEKSEEDSDKADVVSIARAINYAFGEEGEGSLGYSIAVHHEIEVTTPGASDELEGIMFESYKGFTVIVETLDPKKKDGKVKIVEGNLVERTDEFLILNCKGRRRKLKNQNVLSVKLPKAKREKGVK